MAQRKTRLRIGPGWALAGLFAVTSMFSSALLLWSISKLPESARMRMFQDPAAVIAEAFRMASPIPIVEFGGLAILSIAVLYLLSRPGGLDRELKYETGVTTSDIDEGRIIGPRAGGTSFDESHDTDKTIGIGQSEVAPMFEDELTSVRYVSDDGDEQYDLMDVSRIDEDTLVIDPPADVLQALRENRGKIHIDIDE